MIAQLSRAGKLKPDARASHLLCLACGDMVRLSPADGRCRARCRCGRSMSVRSADEVLYVGPATPARYRWDVADPSAPLISRLPDDAQVRRLPLAPLV